MTLRLVVANDGFASPYNPRAVELVLRHAVTGVEHILPLNADPRFWTGGETQTLDLPVAVPSDLVPGIYAAFLNLPDPEAALRRNPDYSIRLANESLWEASTGYNSLQATISVGDAQPPGAVTLEPAAVSGSTVTLVWSAVAGAVEYVVEAGPTPGPSALHNGSVGAATTISATVGAGTYYVRVRGPRRPWATPRTRSASPSAPRAGAPLRPPRRQGWRERSSTVWHRWPGALRQAPSRMSSRRAPTPAVRTCSTARWERPSVSPHRCQPGSPLTCACTPSTHAGRAGRRTRSGCRNRCGRRGVTLGRVPTLPSAPTSARRARP